MRLINIYDYLIGYRLSRRYGIRYSLYKALFDAVITGDLSTVKKYIWLTKDINMINPQGRTLLIQSAQKGQLNIVQYLLAKGASIDQGDFNHITPLMTASRSGHIEIVKYLLKKNAKYNLVNRFGYTALSWAVKWGQTHIAELLLDHGAEIDTLDLADNSLLDLALFAGTEKIIERLLKEKEIILEKVTIKQLYLWSISHDRHDILKGAIDKDNLINQQLSFNLTFLMTAINFGAKKCFYLLLELGADPNLSDLSGKTALMLAVASGIEEFIVTLLDYGADINIQDKYGFKSIDYIGKKNQLHINNMFSRLA